MTQPTKTLHDDPRRAGFTLIEMLAVILIVGILFTFLVGSVMRSGDAVKSKSTRAFIATISAQIEAYESVRGDYPPSTFPDSLETKPTRTNGGAEMLVIALWPADGSFQAPEVDEVRLGNTDGDRTSRTLTTYSSSDAFELVDDWGNPIAYIYRKDYGQAQPYVTFDAGTGEPYDQQVRARLSPKTGDPYNKGTFQLISAGSDGLFGTEDDVCNFKVED